MAWLTSSPHHPRHIFPLPVQRITLDVRGNTYQHCVAAWWEYNGRTEFFATAQEARRVRCALKAGLLAPVSFFFNSSFKISTPLAYPPRMTQKYPGTFQSTRVFLELLGRREGGEGKKAS